MTLDLTPSPRVLRMLGEIDFKAWQCICEIIDNSIDSFSNSGYSTCKQERPTIAITIPVNRELATNSYLEVKDNGMGMTKEALSSCLKAGFSSNNPVDKMGLFGMGFNISTARLGGRTEVITSTPGSHAFLKVTIDFQDLENQGHFSVPIEEIAKKPEEMNTHGTIVRISKLRTEHIGALSQKKRISEKIGKIYGRHIREHNISIKYASYPCKPFKHCIWDESRTGQNKGKVIPAIKKIDKLIDSKKYCSRCWVWLSEYDEKCPSCNQEDSVSLRERRIKGWIGIQRYFDDKHYGIDLIRNGRVISELDKSFFEWDDPSNDDDPELEYPIDGHERKGRIVGELEVDFVKVTHQKDAFEKKSADWKEVIKYVRGDAPMRPQIAKARGYMENSSPLAELFSAFRTAKAGIKNLVPQRKDGGAMITHSDIEELKQKFYQGIYGYETDQKWWELLVRDTNPAPAPKRDINDGSGGNPFVEEPEQAKTGGSSSVSNDFSGSNDSNNINEPINVIVDKLEPDNELSRIYTLELFGNIPVKVIAEKVSGSNHERGYSISARGSELFFKYWPEHSVFKRQLFQPADFLVNELAYQLHAMANNQLSKIPLTEVELSLREKYFPELHPSVDEINRQVSSFLEDAKSHLKDNIHKLGSFDQSVLNEQEKIQISQALAESQFLNSEEISEIIGQGRFLSYAPVMVIIKIIRAYPSLLYDGNFFNKKWSTSETLADKTLFAELSILLTDIESFLRSNHQQLNAIERGRLKRLIGSLEIVTSWRI